MHYIHRLRLRSPKRRSHVIDSFHKDAIGDKFVRMVVESGESLLSVRMTNRPIFSRRSLSSVPLCHPPAHLVRQNGGTDETPIALLPRAFWHCILRPPLPHDRTFAVKILLYHVHTLLLFNARMTATKTPRLSYLLAEIARLRSIKRDCQTMRKAGCT